MEKSVVLAVLHETGTTKNRDGETNDHWGLAVVNMGREERMEEGITIVDQIVAPTSNAMLRFQEHLAKLHRVLGLQGRLVHVAMVLVRALVLVRAVPVQTPLVLSISMTPRTVTMMIKMLLLVLPVKRQRRKDKSELRRDRGNLRVT